MKSQEFPIFKTKTESVTQTFQLDSPAERRKYFDAKAGEEIKKLREYVSKNTFVGFLMGPKGSGKGTYSKLFAEALGDEAGPNEHIRHISVGDIVRAVHKSMENEGEKGELMDFLEKNYRGFLPLEEAIEGLLGRSTKTLVPTELILALIEREISKADRVSLFIDGFPRNLDQISYALFFGALMGYRKDPDFFVFIDVPESVIDERMKYRVVCPECQTPRSIKLLKTKEVGYDAEKKEFYLKCDNPECDGAHMVTKEGDELGIEAIRDRVELEKDIMEKLLGLHGVPKVYLRNAVPVAQADESIDEYEKTPAYEYRHKEGGKVETTEKPWVVKDDQGKESYSLLPPAIVVSFLKQATKVLNL